MSKVPFRALPFAVALVLSANAQAAAPAVQTHDPKPAFPGQTDAPPPAKASPALKVETLATGLTGAWSIAFLPGGRMLVTQAQGTMRIVDPAREWAGRS